MDRFNFVKLIEQARTIDRVIEDINKKLIDCDIGNGNATNALSILDGDLSEIEGKVDFLSVGMTQTVHDLMERNSEIRSFSEDLHLKLERIETWAKEMRSPAQTYLDTPVTVRGYHPRY